MIYKRNNIWWMDVTIDGVRYRQSLETTDKRKAAKEEKRRIQQSASGLLAVKTTDLAKLGFKEAVDEFLKDRKTEIADSSYRKERQLFAKPKEFFGSMPVKKIQAHHLLAYRSEREWTMVVQLT
jgi:hypothetical protein